MTMMTFHSPRVCIHIRATCCHIPQLPVLALVISAYRIYSYFLGKGGYVFGSLGLFVCLSVDNITQKVTMDWDDILWRSPG